MQICSIEPYFQYKLRIHKITDISTDQPLYVQIIEKYTVYPLPIFKTETSE